MERTATPAFQKNPRNHPGPDIREARLIPGKADREAQERFLEAYDEIEKNKSRDDPIYFMDATHPQHNPVLAGGWIKRGEEQEIPTNTGRRRHRPGAPGAGGPHARALSDRIESHDKLDRLFAAL